MQKWLNPSGTPTYFAWRNMRSRCYNPKDVGYKNYGGRGIRVCDCWRKDYDAFFTDMGECPTGLTLERKDGNGDYDPLNCVWTTYTEQLNNRPRFNRWIEFQGRKQTLAQWAKELGVSLELLSWRLDKWPFERAMTAGRVNNWAPGQHGTVSTYTAKKCRCEPCREAKRQSRKKVA